MPEIKCELVKRISKKSGNEYIAVEVVLPNGYKTMLFFNNPAEMYMVKSFID